jgi:hypothetical protein
LAKKKRGRAKAAARKATKKQKRTEAVRPTDKASADLLAQLDGAKAAGGTWRAEVPGDTLVGEVLSDKVEEGKYGEQRVLVIATTDGAQTVFANASLDRALVAEGVEVGDTVGIQFKGGVSVGRGRPMKTFAVRRKGGARTGRSKRLSKAVEEARKSRESRKKLDKKRRRR